MQVQHFPDDRTYTDQHSWLALAPGGRLSDYPLRTGLTPAVVAGRDITAVELPPVRSLVEAGVRCGAIHPATGPAFPIFAPISGLITIHNPEVFARPELLAADPFRAGWLFAILPTPRSSTNGLLTYARYLAEVCATA